MRLKVMVKLLLYSNLGKKGLTTIFLMPQTGALLPITRISTNGKSVLSVVPGFAVRGGLDDEDSDARNQQHGDPATRCEDLQD
jgi:hypothetical protein